MTQPVDWQTAGFSQVFQRGETENGLHLVGVQTGPSLGRQDRCGKSELFTHSASFCCFKCLHTQASPWEKQYTVPRLLPHHQKFRQMPHWQHFKGNLNEDDVHGTTATTTNTSIF